jgi:hypothetical protein
VTIKVYQADDPCLSYHNDSISHFVKENLHNYRHVATVRTNEPIDALRLTRTTSERWWLSDKLTFFGSKEWGTRSCRSTSIGDLLITEDGAILVVAPNETFIRVEL